MGKSMLPGMQPQAQGRAAPGCECRHSQANHN